VTARANPTPSRPEQHLPREQLVEFLAEMLLIRRFEEKVEERFRAGELAGFLHVCIGQEAVAVGASAALRADDYVFATYRGHHHAIARGAVPEACIAELMQKSTGLCKGKGGSMHLTYAAGGMLGSYAIVGAHLPMAVGAAWSAKQRGTGQVAVAFFGDGATNIGAFHEALNLAAVWRLPVIFVCENNLYMEYTPIGAVTAADHPAADRAPAYRLPADIVDGNDAVLVREAVDKAAQRARAGDGPTVVEAETYRHYGHSRTDPAKYRPADEVELWMKHDPIDVARARLEALGVPADRIRQLDEQVAAETAAAVDAAKAAPAADVAEAFTDMCADGGAQWRR